MSQSGKSRPRRAFRFGVSPRLTATRAEWQDIARKAEALGYDVLLMGDHMGNAGSPLPALLSAADATTRLRISPHVLAVDFRNPAILAKEAATIDVLTDGRFELGLGVGWPAGSEFAGDYDQAGINVGRPAARVQRLGEALHIVRAFLRDDQPVNFTGVHFQAAGLVPLPRPVQKAGPPIMVAGAGPRLLEVAARYADIVNFAPRPPIVGRTASGSIGFGLTVADQVDLVRKAAGERFGDLEFATFSIRPVVTDAGNVSDVMDAFAAEYNTSPEVAASIPATLAGSVDALVERLQQHRDELGLSYRIIGGSAMEAFAPVVARLAGR